MDKQEKTRLDFIDNLRVFIIIVVLVHHAANPYGSPDFWYFKSDDPRSGLVGLYLELAPSFTMAVLLVFSGYLLPPSYDRYPFGVFVRDKLLRLGLPLLLGGMIMLPLMQYTYHLRWGYKGYGSFWSYYWNAWLAMGDKPQGWNGPGWPDRNFGHLWYIEHLLFYALCYGACRKLLLEEGPSERVDNVPPPNDRQIVLFALVITLLTFVVRIWFPLTTVVALLGFLQIDLSHFPQWFPFFLVGLAAYRYDWLRTISRSSGYRWLSLGVALTAFHFLLAMTPYDFLRAPGAYARGASWANFAKSAWETFFCVSMCVGLIVFFREALNWRTPTTRRFSENAYAVHVFHPPMVVLAQYLLASIVIATVFKTVLAALLGGTLCFLVTHFIIRRIPGANKIL